jgi:hypothetical protein
MHAPPPCRPTIKAWTVEQAGREYQRAEWLAGDAMARMPLPTSGSFQPVLEKLRGNSNIYRCWC